MAEVTKEIEVTIDLDLDDIGAAIEDLSAYDKLTLLEDLMKEVPDRSFVEIVEKAINDLSVDEIVNLFKTTHEAIAEASPDEGQRLAHSLWEHLMPFVEGRDGPMKRFAKQRLESMKNVPEMWGSTEESYAFQMVVIAEMLGIQSFDVLRAIFGPGNAIQNLPLTKERALEIHSLIVKMIDEHEEDTIWKAKESG